ncbi:MAG: sel1 repeat family protein [Verrucomicrobiaceae bacterium]|nr:MAG: sel1 repeat family protein [Verrucomicrobiaceae bacterium]
MKRILLLLLLTSPLAMSKDHTKEPLPADVLKNIQESAKKGDAKSEYELGSLLSTGEYLPKNISEAFKLLLHSAQQGYSKAEYKLGLAYFNGEGVSKDPVEGLAWMYLALADDLPDGVCKTMESAVDSAGKKKAKQRANEITEKTLPGDAKTFLLLKENAPKGDAETQYKLGMCYQNRKNEPMDVGEAIFQMTGTGVVDEDNIKKAVKWFKLSAEQGYAPAQKELGNAYESGQIEDKGNPVSISTNSKVNAMTWWRKAAEQGNAPAQNNLGGAYIQGWMSEIRFAQDEKSGERRSFDDEDIVEKEDKSNAVLWFRKAANQGYALAQKNLADCYFKGEGVAEDKPAAVAWYQKAAAQGLFLAQSALGAAYANGDGIDKDLTQAFQWYSKAATQGDSNANRRLGDMYMNGTGVEKNEQKAIKCYEEASGIGGNEVAMRKLGDAYSKGTGVPKDSKQAFFWHYRAGNCGDDKGAFETGNHYLSGDGVEKNNNDAMDWYGCAAQNGYGPALKALSDLGDLNAQLMLGELLLRNKSDKAIEPLKKAVASGNADAAYILAHAYYDGNYFPKNPVEGLAWMNVAASSKNNSHLNRHSDVYRRSFFISKSGQNHQWTMIQFDELSSGSENRLAPDSITASAKKVCSEWGAAIGQDASLKALQRSKEINLALDGTH